MNLDTFQAIKEGYEDRMFDQQLIAVQSGYWSGYYMSKKPKPLGRILDILTRNRLKANTKSGHVDFVDVEAFLATEAQFQQRLREQRGE